MKKKSKSKQVKTRVAATKDITARKKEGRFPMFNLLICILFWMVMVAVFYSGRLMRPQELALGQKAPDTIVASVDFLAESIAATELKQRAAADQVLPVFSIDTSGLMRARQALSKLEPKLKSLRTTTDPQQVVLIENSINDVRDFSSISLSTEELLKILPDGDADLQTPVLDAIATVPRAAYYSPKRSRRLPVQQRP